MNQILNTVEPVNCSSVAEPQEVLTSENLSHLAADNYNVTPGSIVNIRCLSNESHKLIGVNSLTCLDSGQWNHPLPKCVPKSWNDNIQFITPITNRTLTLNTQKLDFGKIPLIVGISLLCFSCVSIAVLLIYLIYVRRKRAIETKKARVRSHFVSYNSHIASTAETLTANSEQPNKIDTEATYCAPSMSYHVPSKPYDEPFYIGRMNGSL
ncbi:hypothetical protein CHS0354_000985 [Potamilus streckersoni]|uniref:Sushi domain-containing protein n=1 Tax=Potamilus streckersoni TaxID=2493646 RepID=A0AAE0VW69_9BIVA|nr:hypothetical protein CHS0354_000985 [Potamilus streckersoni]